MTKCRTDGTSVFNTRTARRRLPSLDPARREGEVEEDSIQQQHNGVEMMEERGNPAGLRQAPQERRSTWERGEGCNQRHRCVSRGPLPQLYIGIPRGGCASLRRSNLLGAAARGG